MAEYQLTATEDFVIRTRDGGWIPDEPANRDWQEYQAWLSNPGNTPDPCSALSPSPVTVLPQDLMAQLTTDDAAKIQPAIASSAPDWLLWQAMTAQRDPMVVSNARFRQGWQALAAILGADRMNAIAAALKIMA
jgi:hypothetical protein